MWIRKLLPTLDTRRRTQHRWLLNRFVYRAQPLQLRTLKHNKTQQQLQVGDHIYIKNKISHSDRPNVADRAGVVTDIAHYLKQQVFLTTYSGVEMWRSPLNLRRLSAEEKIRLRKQQDE